MHTIIIIHVATIGSKLIFIANGWTHQVIIVSDVASLPTLATGATGVTLATLATQTLNQLHIYVLLLIHIEEVNFIEL